ncbi:hypothetical protein ZIOFF_006514 [Zingiber officinale]|uniref:Uncharacterized protein n=1 Tax=Zingiber officinale TaxID=94328 RepID=A0A8J5LSC5_ZINOF|nr:hypothetical protein ZIOFF_006514 [Zingiber officinale]
MFQGVHDPNEEKVVKSLRDTLLSKGQLPEKYDDYHTLLRAKQDGPVVLTATPDASKAYFYHEGKLRTAWFTIELQVTCEMGS